VIRDRDQRSVRTVNGHSLLAVSLALALAASPVAAQSDTPRVCTVYGAEAGPDGVQSVFAQCWGTGLGLGSADHFTSSVNFELGATVVELVRGDHRRVLLLRALPDGQPIVEDLGSVLALSAGRGPLAGIDNLTIDAVGYANDGVLDVAESDGQATAAGDFIVDRADGAVAVEPGLGEQPISDVAPAIAPGRVNVAALVDADPKAASAQIEP
jgi:hypothetical protein